jgi:hypothetical protein
MPELDELLENGGWSIVGKIGQLRYAFDKDAWARVTKEIETFKTIIEQAGIKKL